jgi:hypothetical protein
MTNDRVMGSINLIGVVAGVQRQKLALSTAIIEMFRLKMETESSIRNTVFLNTKDRKMNNVQICDTYMGCLKKSFILVSEMFKLFNTLNNG